MLIIPMRTKVIIVTFDIKHEMYVSTLITGPEMLIDLANELVEVVWWYNLGIQLKAPRHVLETIRVDHRSTEDQKNALFGWWLNNTLEEERKWSRIVKALARAGYRSLAERIAFKYSKKRLILMK